MRIVRICLQYIREEEMDAEFSQPALLIANSALHLADKEPASEHEASRTRYWRSPRLCQHCSGGDVVNAPTR